MTAPQKRRLEVFPFTWQRDLKGYSLTRGAKSIVRNGGPMQSYSLTEDDNVPLESFLQVMEGDEESALAFVQQYGFLHGSDTQRVGMFQFARDAAFLGTFAKLVKHEKVAKAFNALQSSPRVKVTLSGTAAEGYRLALVPESLWDWLWLQVAMKHADGAKLNHHCEYEYCKKPMFRGGRGGLRGHREDARFCSDKCRTYFNRNAAKGKRK